MLKKIANLFFLISGIIIVMAQLDPEIYWVFGALSLIVPIVVLVNLLALIYFIIMKNRMLFLPLGLIILSFGYILDTFNMRSIIDTNLEERGSDFLIFSHNVGGLREYSELSTSSYFRDIQFSNFDIICLQEFRKSNADSTIEEFLSRANIRAYSQYFSGKKMTPANLGLLILSRHPIVNQGQIMFGENSFNGVNYVDVKISTDTLRVYNFHFKSYNFAEVKDLKNAYYVIKNAIPERSRRMKQLIEELAKSPYPAILAGDLNESQSSYIYRELSKKASDSYFHGEKLFSQTYSKVPLRIDYIFACPGVTLDYFEVYTKNYFSDHFPIWARIKL